MKQIKTRFRIKIAKIHSDIKTQTYTGAFRKSLTDKIVKPGNRKVADGKKSVRTQIRRGNIIVEIFTWIIAQNEKRSIKAKRKREIKIKNPAKKVETERNFIEIGNDSK